MNRARTLLLGAAVLAAGAAVAAGRTELPAVPLPPLARVVTSGPGGAMWRETGELSGSVASARGELTMALAAQGWALSKTIVLGRAPAGSELMVWTQRKRRVLVMVWEKEAGTCGFAWGEER